MSPPGVMNYKRHNQGYRAHVRRKYLGGYWLPKWARENFNNFMPTYTSSKGIQKDTSDMPIEYIERALSVAKKENNQNNIDALEYEINLRQGKNG